MQYTVVSFHAHPDDEALLTAGTLARAAADGHRVVLVAAPDGAAGLSSSELTRGLAARRRAELERAGRAIGCHDVRFLGYADSGMHGEAAQTGPTFSTADVDEAAGRLAAILAETSADVLTIYDPAGGYGHPDHVQVHRVGIRAAELAGTPVVLEATVDRRLLVRALRLLGAIRLTRLLNLDPAEWSPERFARAYADPARITHCVPIRAQSGAKRGAMAAHSSQAAADEGVRTLAAFLRLPPLLFKVVFAHEWFVERGRAPGARPLGDIFASLRDAPPGSEPTGADPG